MTAFEEAGGRNLQRKFPDSARMLVAMARELRLVEHRPGLESPEGLAEKDRPIFRAARACGAGILLTGDLRDFGRFILSRRDRIAEPLSR